MQSEQTGQSAIRVIQWVVWADQDYIGARALLLNGSLVQGCSLSNTALEKYLKGILTISGSTVPHTHDVVKLYEHAKERGRMPPLNEGYLRTLVKAYRLRYPDELEEGFSISLAQFQLLAELDASVRAIRNGFGFQKGDGSPVQTRLDLLLSSNDPRLTSRNAAFTSFDRADMFSDASDCYELRVMANGAVMEATYRADVKDTRSFEIEGLRPGTETPKPTYSPIGKG